MTDSKPTLFLVATPVGNLEDMTYRAVRVLSEVAEIFAEDTRVSRVLLERYGVTTPIKSYREAAPRGMVERTIAEVITRLKAGESVAYISDAGTPAVSDPGSYLVKRVVEMGFVVSPIPGASALPMIISVSGMPVTQPLFVGFLPHKKGKQTLLAKLKEALVSETADAVIFYESPARIVSLMEYLAAWELPLQLCVGRELTKKFEDVFHGSLEEMTEILADTGKQRGEFVVLVGLASKDRHNLLA
jgi:16S rRNA (cytidine1402-2'-O)-methyltransferase